MLHVRACGEWWCRRWHGRAEDSEQAYFTFLQKKAARGLSPRLGRRLAPASLSGCCTPNCNPPYLPGAK